MKNQIKELRVRIDGLAQLTKELKPIKLGEKSGAYYGHLSPFNSKEIEKAVDSLYLAKAWLGKVLGELGTETPYKNDGNRKSKKDIENTADTNNKINFPMNHHINVNLSIEERGKELNHIEKVDWLRQEIKKLVDNSEDFSKKEPSIELEQGFVYKYLCEARFWLRFELQRIKEND